MTTETFNCTHCGGPLTLRAKGASLSVACPSCRAVLDAQDPRHQVLSRYEGAVREQPVIPLGTRGKLRGEEFEAIGYMKRAVSYEGVPYEWSEYLLYNPFKGFRWLVEYNGHWTYFRQTTERPKEN